MIEYEQLYFSIGSKYQELPFSKMADFAELFLSASFVADRYTTPELSHGAVVSHAFPDASRFPVT